MFLQGKRPGGVLYTKDNYCAITITATTLAVITAPTVAVIQLLLSLLLYY